MNSANKVLQKCLGKDISKNYRADWKEEYDKFKNRVEHNTYCPGCKKITNRDHTADKKTKYAISTCQECGHTYKMYQLGKGNNLR